MRSWLSALRLTDLAVYALCGIIVVLWYTRQAQSIRLMHVEQQWESQQQALKDLETRLLTQRAVVEGMAASILKQDDKLREVVTLTREFHTLLQQFGTATIALRTTVEDLLSHQKHQSRVPRKP